MTTPAAAVAPALPVSTPDHATRALSRRRRLTWPVLVLGLALAAAVLLASGAGAVTIAPAQVAAIVVAPAGVSLPVTYELRQAAIVWQLRLPRIVLAVLLGGGLALCGAAMQGLFRNALADPGLTGVSSGAALGTVSCIVFAGALGFRSLPLWTPTAAAFTGGLLAVAVVQILGRVDGRTSVTHLLLTGIAVNAFCGAGVGLATFIANDAQLRSITFWTLGSLGGASWSVCGFLTLLTIACGALLIRQSRLLNVLLLGEAEAGHLGFRVETSKRIVLACTALLAGAAVSVAGIIGFIGLIAPHLTRLALGPDHRSLLPVSALGGALLLLVADTLCRTVAAPAEIPVGIATALLGAPFFLWLLWRERRP